MINKRLTAVQRLLKQVDSYILFLKRFSANLWAMGSTKNCERCQILFTDIPLVFFSTCVYNSMLEMFSIRHRSLGNRHSFYPCKINNILFMYLFTCFHTGMLIGNVKMSKIDNRNCLRFDFFMLTFFIFIAFTFEVFFSVDQNTKPLSIY